jgi:hypothetical protein
MAKRKCGGGSNSQKEDRGANTQEGKKNIAKQELGSDPGQGNGRNQRRKEWLNLPITVKRLGNLNLRPHIHRLDEEEQKEALATWQALAKRLLKEDAI